VETKLPVAGLLCDCGSGGDVMEDMGVAALPDEEAGDMLAKRSLTFDAGGGATGWLWLRSLEEEVMTSQRTLFVVLLLRGRAWLQIGSRQNHRRQLLLTPSLRSHRLLWAKQQRLFHLSLRLPRVRRQSRKGPAQALS
jgi:hypothetical protein